jgi:hypothetical protein
MMLTDIMQKSALNSYLVAILFYNLPSFSNQCHKTNVGFFFKFLHFVDISSVDTNTGPQQLFKILAILEVMN